MLQSREKLDVLGEPGGKVAIISSAKYPANRRNTRTTALAPFGAAAIWAGTQRDCLVQQSPKNYARRTFACATAFTYALNNARLALCPEPGVGGKACRLFSSTRVLLRAQAECETFQCTPPDLMHLQTSIRRARITNT